MLGLRKGIVELSPYDPEWPAAYESERGRLSNALPRLGQIEHIGSTAIPGALAKPIVDIAAVVADDTLRETWHSVLLDLGYRYRGDSGASGGHVYMLEDAQSVRTHCLHVVHGGDPQWQAWLDLRDYLIDNPSALARYNGVKKSLAGANPSNRRAYSAGKAETVRSLLVEARRRLKRDCS